MPAELPVHPWGPRSYAHRSSARASPKFKRLIFARALFARGVLLSGVALRSAHGSDSSPGHISSKTTRLSQTSCRMRYLGVLSGQRQRSGFGTPPMQEPSHVVPAGVGLDCRALRTKKSSECKLAHKWWITRAPFRPRRHLQTRSSLSIYAAWHWAEAEGAGKWKQLLLGREGAVMWPKFACTRSQRARRSEHRRRSGAVWGTMRRPRRVAVDVRAAV